VLSSLRVLVLVGVVCFVTGCAGEKTGSKKTASSRPRDQVEMEEIEVGSGPKPKEGDTVLVHYTGRLKNGEMFDSSYRKGEAFEVKLGAKQVIDGWEEALPEMQVGGKYKVTVPPAKGYGADKKPGIPANSTLIFEMELIRIEPKDKKKKKPSGPSSFSRGRSRG
jgi:FKBP-type peptidyl-prolyl cis-trans isomerase